MSDESDVPTGVRCKCRAHMAFVLAWDDAQETDHAYNVFGCSTCGLLLKIDVWKDKGRRWIALDGSVLKEDM